MSRACVPWKPKTISDRNIRIIHRLMGGDLEPERADASVHQVVTLGVANASGRFNIVAVYLPEPPSEPFKETDQVRLLRNRWRDAREGRSPLLAEAEFVLTSLRGRFGRNNPDRELSLDRGILSKLGRLGEYQHPAHGRKVKSGRPELTDREYAWIAAVVPQLIYRLGQVEGGATALPPLRMDDLPPL